LWPKNAVPNGLEEKAEKIGVKTIEQHQRR
jgi:hypothetical protein